MQGTNAPGGIDFYIAAFASVNTMPPGALNIVGSDSYIRYNVPGNIDSCISAFSRV